MQQIIFSIENIDEVGIRIDKLIFDKIPESKEVSRNKIKKLILDGSLNKNGEIFKNVSYKTKINDKFLFNLPSFKLKIKPQNIKLDVVYEDDDMLVINKQAGLISHIGAGKFEGTLVNALLYHYGRENLSDVNGEERLGIVHRLDKDTSGLMVVAKNNKAHMTLAEQIKTKVLKRNYMALVWGVPFPRKGEICGYIGRNKRNRLKMSMYQNKKEGKYSLTNYEVKDVFKDNILSLIECKLDTGRTHQIRVHFSHKKHPLVGDRLYGGHSRKIAKKSGFNDKIKSLIEYFPRQVLHSYKISFIQPTTKGLKEFIVDYPQDIKRLISVLKT